MKRSFRHLVSVFCVVLVLDCGSEADALGFSFSSLALRVGVRDSSLALRVDMLRIAAAKLTLWEFFITRLLSLLRTQNGNSSPRERRSPKRCLLGVT